MIKRLIILGLFLVFVVFSIFAGGTNNIWISVTVTAPASFVITNLSTTNWNITGNFNYVTNRDVATVLSNDGSASIAFILSLTNLGTWTNSVDNINGVDEYVLQAIFNGIGDAQATNSNYTNDDVVVTIPIQATTTNFANAALWPGNDGSFVGPGEKRNLWLRYQLPSGGSVNGGQPYSCKLIITATVK